MSDTISPALLAPPARPTLESLQRDIARLTSMVAAITPAPAPRFTIAEGATVLGHFLDENELEARVLVNPAEGHVALPLGDDHGTVCTLVLQANAALAYAAAIIDAAMMLGERPALVRPITIAAHAPMVQQ